MNNVKYSYYIRNWGLCDCGSSTYAHYFSSQNIFYNMVDYIICGGCARIFLPDELPKTFEGIRQKIQSTFQENCKE